MQELLWHSERFSFFLGKWGPSGPPGWPAGVVGPARVWPLSLSWGGIGRPHSLPSRALQDPTDLPCLARFKWSVVDTHCPPLPPSPSVAGPGGWAGTLCHGWQVQSTSSSSFCICSSLTHIHLCKYSSLLFWGASVLATHTLLLPQHYLGRSQARGFYLLNPLQPALWVVWSDRKQWRHGGCWITGQWSTNRSAKWIPHPPCPLTFPWTLLITLSLFPAWPGYHFSLRPKPWSLPVC